MNRRRLLLALVGILVGLEVGWILAFDWAAKSGQLERWVNRRPDRFVLHFDSARSYAPFHFSVSGLEFSVQTPRWHWSVAADAAAGEISPLALLGRKLRLHRLEGEGVRVFARRRAASAAEAEAAAGTIPEIDPWPHFESDPAPWRYAENPWNYEFPSVRVREARELWIEQVRFLGELHADGAFAFRRRREAEIARTRFELLSGRATFSGEPLADGLSGRIEGSIAPYPYREERGVDMLPHLSLDAELEGTLHDGTVLRRYLARAAWLEFEDGAAPFRGAARVRDGNLAPGTRVEIDRPERRLDFFGFQATGSSRLELDVGGSPGRPQIGLSLRFEDFELRRHDEEEADFAGRGLELSARTFETRLGALPRDTRLRLDLGEARLVNLRTLSSLLPASAGVELLGGSGPVEGHLDVDLAGDSAEGKFGLRIVGAHARAGELEGKGEIRFSTLVSSASVAERKFDLDGARLDLSGFTPTSPDAPSSPGSPASRAHPESGATASTRPADESWWARVEAPRAELHLADPAHLHGELRAKLKNSAPLVALYDARRNLPRWIEGLLSSPDVEARTDLRWQRGELRISGLEVGLENARIAGDLDLRRGDRHGRLLLVWRKLALGIELNGTDRRHHFRGAREWFESTSATKADN